MSSQSSTSSNCGSLVSSLLLAVSFCGAAQAQVAPNLGTNSTYAVVSSTYTNTLNPTSLNGTPSRPVLCYTTGPTVTPSTMSGTLLIPCPSTTGTDRDLALATLNSQACVSLGPGAILLNAVTIGANPPGTIPPGCYSSGGTMDVTVGTTVTLNGNGVYVFRPGGALTTGANSRVILAGGSCADNVFWAPPVATLGATTEFVGNILVPSSTAITMGNSTNLLGRAIAFGSTVTTAAVTITVPPVCAAPPPVVLPTLVKAFNPGTITTGGTSTLTVTLGNANAAVATLTAPLVDTLPGGVVVANTPNANTTCGGAGAIVAVAAASSVTLPAGRTIPANGTCTLTVDVTSALVGTYINTLPVGALVTSNGNNPAPANATLTVIAPVVLPSLAKAFNASSIIAGGTSTLTVTLGNANATVATLTASLVDTLPTGVVIANAPNASTTCGGAGAPIAIAGGASVTLPAGRSIPANGNCTLSVEVTAAFVGSYLNTLPVGALMTSNGNNPAPATATLTVTAVAFGFNPNPAPTLSEWAMIMLVGLLAIAGFAAIRKQEN